MRRIKAVASPSQLGLWDELDELDDPAAFHRNETMSPSADAFGGDGPSAPPAPVGMRPDAIEARPASRKTP
jgi:hypothetical protein